MNKRRRKRKRKRRRKKKSRKGLISSRVTNQKGPILTQIMESTSKNSKKSTKKDIISTNVSACATWATNMIGLIAVILKHKYLYLPPSELSLLRHSISIRVCRLMRWITMEKLSLSITTSQNNT